MKNICVKILNSVIVTNSILISSYECNFDRWVPYVIQINSIVVTTHSYTFFIQNKIYKFRSTELYFFLTGLYK